MYKNEYHFKSDYHSGAGVHISIQTFFSSILLRSKSEMNISYSYIVIDLIPHFYLYQNEYHFIIEEHSPASVHFDTDFFL